MTLLDFIFLTRIMHNTFIYITLNILDKSGVYRCFPQIHFHLRICPDFGNLLQCPFLKRIDFYQLTSNCGFQKLKFANEMISQSHTFVMVFYPQGYNLPVRRKSPIRRSNDIFVPESPN